MLYLTRRPGEAVIINNAIEVRVVELKGKSVKLGFTFPSDASVLREEVFLQIKAENEAAVAAAADDVLRARTGAVGNPAAKTSGADHPSPRPNGGGDARDRLATTTAGSDRPRSDDS